MESFRHKNLKRAAKKWLIEECGCDEVRYEVFGFDVVGYKDGYIFAAVECGSLWRRPRPTSGAFPILILPYGIFGSCNINAIRELTEDEWYRNPRAKSVKLTRKEVEISGNYRQSGH